MISMKYGQIPEKCFVAPDNKTIIRNCMTLREDPLCLRHSRDNRSIHRMNKIAGSKNG
jgi:hypothetical protein